ncbi:hypothetical protein MRS76_25985 [Rhizobiaceae bacterium n13]|uniref:Tyr recombinase domain-containing protein n=1 Tax=Ferirhizobium litorale TaxID=2927786 RepID=A0AAE3U649_9HYPH|nr:tyrosine-type recombinase/integrase [Fererhizobium litorale]MDI7865339.1 hypothetical protein [Fererhizobium litorale]MDI7924734.1 hypothetical protein [Fererhizobium litorale]
MRGLFKRKGSDVWQGRFRVPEDIWRERGRILEVDPKGMGKSQEFASSTGYRDRDDAAVEYRRMLNEWEGRIVSWRSLLEDGPQDLTHRQRVALAAERAKTLLTANEDEPFNAPPPPPIQTTLAPRQEVERLFALMSPDDLKRLGGDLTDYLAARGPTRRKLAFRLLEDHPVFASIMALDLTAGLEAAHGEDVDAALTAHGLHITKESRRLLALAMEELKGAAYRGLEARMGGDYSPVKELEVAPKFEASPSPAALRGPDPRFTFAAIVKTETIRRASGRDAKPFPAATIKKYSRRGEEFVEWRRTQGLHKAAAEDSNTVTRQEVEKWRAAMLAQKDEPLSNRTINDKVACIRTIIKWGLRHYRDSGFHPSGNPLEGIEKLGFVETPSDLRTYRLEEAAKVLMAARRETESRRRWLSWICAYTGLRIEEAGQLTVEDFFTVQGRWFFRVSTSGRRSLKTASSERRIPVHSSLIKEGLLEFVTQRKTGRLFTSRRVQPLMSEWIRSEVKITRPELSPNHGWRHFFEDLCGLANMPDAAREYMTGRASGKSREMYGRSELMLPGLAEAMDRVPDILELASRKH